MSEPPTTEAEVSAERAAEMLAAGAAQFVDVRQLYEWEEGRIAGSVHIPLETLPARAAEVDQDRPVIFVCRSGARSAMATQAFRASGVDALNLVGGLEAWTAAGLDVKPAQGSVASPRHDNT